MTSNYTGRAAERPTSAKLFEEAQRYMPGGVNSPVRAFKSVGGSPVYFKRGSGAHIYDEDDNCFIDYINSWGPAIAGHANSEVVAAVKEAVDQGFGFGCPTRAETELAKQVQAAKPSIEKLRLVSSGTEACMSAIRLARAFTKRDGILKFAGCYHGHADMLLVKAGSGALTLGLPDSPGVPRGATEHTYTAPFNDLQAVEQAFTTHKDKIGAIIIEPMVGNSGFIRPAPGFLEGLRALCDQTKTLLIFDEVMTGFRVAFGGVQGLTGVKPDLTTLGKVIGGGLPIGAYGGRGDIMDLVAPAGPVYQAGTLSGNPVAVACGRKTLEIMARPGQYSLLSARTTQLVNGLTHLAGEAKIPFDADCEGGMFGFFFRPGRVSCYEEAATADQELFRRFHRGMLEHGVYLAPSSYEAGFLSIAHTEEIIDQTLEAAAQVFASLR